LLFYDRLPACTMLFESATQEHSEFTAGVHPAILLGEFLNRDLNLESGGIPIAGGRSDTLVADGHELGPWCVEARRAGNQLGYVAGAQTFEHLVLRDAIPQASSGQSRVQHHSYGEDIGAPVDGHAERLFRRHVVRLAFNLTRL